MNGDPVASAVVEFELTTNADEQYFGTTGEDGTLFVTYRTRKGMPPGQYRIRVRYETTLEGQPVPPGEEGGALRSQDKVITKVYAFDQELIDGANQLELQLDKARIDDSQGDYVPAT